MSYAFSAHRPGCSIRHKHPPAAGLDFIRAAAPFALGALLVGIFSEWIHHPQWKLLLITGFLGSLTTFSDFPLKMVKLMQAQR